MVATMKIAQGAAATNVACGRALEAADIGVSLIGSCLNGRGFSVQIVTQQPDGGGVGAR